MTAVLDRSVMGMSDIELHRLQKLYEFPDFVQSALSQDSLTKEAEATLPPNSFADPRDRRFPCHSAPATWLSSLQFLEDRHNLNPKIASWVEERLLSFVGRYGIKAAYDTLHTRHQELHKDATDSLPDSYFAYIWVDEDTGVKSRRCPLRNPGEIKQAADWFGKYRDDFEFQDRRRMADRILQQAVVMETDLGSNLEMLQKQACMGTTSQETVANAIRARAYLAKDAETKERLHALANSFGNIPGFLTNVNSRVKVAEVLDKVDRDLNLAGKYTDLIPRPEDALFGVTFQKISNWRDDHCQTTSGTIYRKEDFSKISSVDLQALFGQDFVETVSDGLRLDPEKLAEISSTLPLAEARMFDQLMSETGVRPVALSKLGGDLAPVGLSPDALSKLAQLT